MLSRIRDRSRVRYSVSPAAISTSAASPLSGSTAKETASIGFFPASPALKGSAIDDWANPNQATATSPSQNRRAIRMQLEPASTASRDNRLYRHEVPREP